MDFDLSEDQRVMRDSLRQFLKRECPIEYVPQCDEAGRFPHELYEKLAKDGWLGLPITEEYDGTGGSCTDLAVFLEEFASHFEAGANTYYTTIVIAADAISHFGTEQQKRDLLPRLAHGEIRFAFSLSEPHSGSDAASSRTQAVRDGDEWVINGQKMFCSCAQEADYILLMARTDKEAPKHEGISMILLDPETKGVELRKLKKLDLKPMDINEIFLTDVRVPVANVIGEVNRGWHNALKTLDYERCCLSAVNVGAAQSCLDKVLTYTKEREQFGQKIASFQLSRAKLADMEMELEDGAFYTLMQGAAGEDLMICLHAENAGIIDRARAEAVHLGHTEPKYHALTRPPVTEVEAISRALLFAEDTGCPLHILHLVAQKGVDLIERARRKGQRVTAETCTHYLALTDEAYERENAQYYVMSPPLRSAENQAALWDGLKCGVLIAVTSDEVSYSAAAKSLGITSFADIANGCPGVHARLPVLYTLGAAEGRLSLKRFTEVFSSWPARMFGVGDRKGQIRKGYDADVVVIDPETSRVMDASSHYGNIGYTPYEGMDLVGWPVLTVYRGRVVVRDGKFLGEAGQGRFLHRGATDMPEIE